MSDEPAPGERRHNSAAGSRGPSQELDRYIAHLERLLDGGEDARRRASVAVRAFVRTVLLARALRDEALSDEIVRDVRAALKPAR